MYITTVKKNNTITNTDYNTLMSLVIEPAKYYKTTFFVEQPTPFNKLSLTQQYRINDVIRAIQEAYHILEPFKDNYTEQYYEFKIPKRSGGLRTINAPLTNFKDALSKVKDIFEQKIKCLAHNAAYAYTKFRSTYDALELHQKNQSNWYLKLDLQDFFPSCTPEFIYSQLMQLYPFAHIVTPCVLEQLKEIIKMCCLNGGLPQGTPMSPLLTNLIMVPFDYHIHKLLSRGTGEHYVYTRYADDILISSKNNFDWRTLQTQLAGILRPFTIKESKTRYGSRAGSNWNLGLMLNKDNNITLGSVKKKQLNAMLNNFLKDFVTHTTWTKEDTYTLQGQLSYLKHIEPDYYNYILQKYEAKYNTTYALALKNVLNPD